MRACRSGSAIAAIPAMASAEKIDKTTWSLSTSGNHPCITFSYDITDERPRSIRFQPRSATWILQLGRGSGVSPGPAQRTRLPAHTGCSRRMEAARRRSLRSRAAPRNSRRLGDRAQLRPPGRCACACSATLYESSFRAGWRHLSCGRGFARRRSRSAQSCCARSRPLQWTGCRIVPTTNTRSCIWPPMARAAEAWNTPIPRQSMLSRERLKQDVLSAAGVSAHEFFHLWNVKRIRPQSLEPIDYTREQYSRALWFSEGVTSTVADIHSDARGTLRREALARTSGFGDRGIAVAQRPSHAIGGGVQPGYMVRSLPELSSPRAQHLLLFQGRNTRISHRS